MKNFQSARSVPSSLSRAGTQNGASASQNMIAMLEARIAKLENILGINGTGDIRIEADNITLQGNRVTIESSGKMQLKAYSNLKVDGTSVDVRSLSTLKLNASSMFLDAANLDLTSTNGTFSASGSLDLSGGSVASLAGVVTKIGKGLLPVATASVAVSAAGFSLSSTIASPNVLA